MRLNFLSKDIVHDLKGHLCFFIWVVGAGCFFAREDSFSWGGVGQVIVFTGEHPDLLGSNASICPGSVTAVAGDLPSLSEGVGVVNAHAGCSPGRGHIPV